MGGKLVILHWRGCNFAWIRVWIHLDPRGARMRQVYYLQHFRLDPCLDPLGSMMRKVYYLQHLRLDPSLDPLGSTCKHYAAGEGSPPETFWTRLSRKSTDKSFYLLGGSFSGGADLSQHGTPKYLDAAFPASTCLPKVSISSPWAPEQIPQLENPKSGTGI